MSKANLVGSFLRVQRALRFAASAVALGTVVIASVPAHAQFSDSYQFLDAVKKRDGDKATKFLDVPASQIVNTKDVTTGRTALYIVIDRRDSLWLDFLIQRHANVNVADVRGTTPLMEAVNVGWTDGVTALLQAGARVDETDNTGGTPLITAVHRRDLAMVRTLLSSGANPDRPDNSGRSARDYVELDGPSNPAYDAIVAIKKGSVATKKVYGPTF